MSLFPKAVPLRGTLFGCLVVWSQPLLPLDAAGPWVAQCRHAEGSQVSGMQCGHKQSTPCVLSKTHRCQDQAHGMCSALCRNWVPALRDPGIQEQVFAGAAGGRRLLSPPSSRTGHLHQPSEPLGTAGPHRAGLPGRQTGKQTHAVPRGVRVESGATHVCRRAGVSLRRWDERHSREREHFAKAGGAGGVSQFDDGRPSKKLLKDPGSPSSDDRQATMLAVDARSPCSLFYSHLSVGSGDFVGPLLPPSPLLSRVPERASPSSPHLPPTTSLSHPSGPIALQQIAKTN